MPITFDYETQVLEGHQELVTRLWKFSKMPVSVPHKIDFKKYIHFDSLSRRLFKTWSPDIKAYANGYDSTTEGYLTVEFAEFYFVDMAVNLACVIAVIDAEGKRRFPRSFSVRHEFTESEPDEQVFRIDRYISRRVLLNEPSELIPDDTLSLHIDFHIVLEPTVSNRFNASSSDSCLEMSEDGETYFLPLDSKLGKRLCEEFKYFECLLTSPLTEGGPRHKIISFEGYVIFETKKREVEQSELEDFENIEEIMFCTTVEFYLMDDVFRVYKTADKYDIPLVVDFCRSCLELSLTPGSALKVLEFAEVFHDDRLRETVRNFHAADCRLQDESEFVVHSRATGMDYEWIFRRSHKYNEYGEWIGNKVFYKGSHDAYDFYR